MFLALMAHVIELLEDFPRYDWLSQQAVPLIGQMINYDLIMIRGEREGWALEYDYDLIIVAESALIISESFPGNPCAVLCSPMRGNEGQLMCFFSL